MLEGICYVNGTFCEAEAAKVSIFDRGFLFGDAIYEVMRVHKGKLFRAADHFRRMSGGLQALRIPVPFSLEEFQALGDGLIQRNSVTCGLVYLEVTRGAGKRSHRLVTGLTPTVVGFAVAGDFPAWKKFPNGVSIVTVPDVRWQRCNLKTTMLLANSIAKETAAEAGAFEAVLVAQDETVREGSSMGLFAVVDGILRTHPADKSILPSITRQVVLELAAQLSIPVREEAFTERQLRSAEEVFLVSTTCDVCPVTQINGAPVAAGTIGPITSRLISAFARALDGA